MILVGLNHQTAAIDLREQFALDGCGLRMALDDLRGRDVECADESLYPPSDTSRRLLLEVVILSTCNRLEVYALVEDAQRGWAAIERYLAQVHNVAPATLHGLLYFGEGRETVEHLLRVAAGLDSLILGEPQILGQVAAAVAEAQVAGTIGPVLSHLFHQALHCGKRARTETAIGSYTTSISHAAAQVAVTRFGNLAMCHALVLGAGEMAELAAVALQQHGAASITCINRTQARAERLARRVNGTALAWPNLVTALAAADIVVAATSAPHPVLMVEHVHAALALRDGRPLLLLDIALPRDIEVTVDDLPGVQRVDIDHLRDTVDANLARRTAAVPTVERIVEAESDAYLDWVQGRQVAPALIALRRKAERMAGVELERTLRRLGHLDGADPKVEHEVAYLAHRIINKLLHEPTVRLKAQAANGNGAVYAHVLQELFALESTARDTLPGSQNGTNHG